MARYVRRSIRAITFAAFSLLLSSAKAEDARLRAEAYLDSASIQLKIDAANDDASALRFALSSSKVIDAAAIWGGDGEMIYPDENAITHFSDRAVLRDPERLKRLLDGATPSKWERRDDQKLHYCRKDVSSICLVVNAQALSEHLNLPKASLFREVLAEYTGSSLFLIWLLPMLGILASIGWFFHRRRAGTGPQTTLLANADSTFMLGDIKVDTRTRIAIRDTLTVELSERDIKLLRHLASHSGHVLEKDELYDAGWGREFQPNSRALEQHMMTLRRKLDPDKTRPTVIETVHGQGYRFPSPPPQP